MIRKIVHVDMDAFYASVEQRDDPKMRGKPVVVAWRGNRSVVCAASYEARRFGVRSAMRAERLCPEAIFIPPDFIRYRAVSHATREIFQRYTDLIEPLSLDETYLDVTENKTGSDRRSDPEQQRIPWSSQVGFCLLISGAGISRLAHSGRVTH
jgi:DNA polymerase-4